MKTKLLKNVFSSAIITGFIAFSVSCTVKQENDVCRVTALNDSLWKCSSWISVSDAPVVTGKVIDGTRSADGASWFVTTVTNSKDVRQALWMTTGLGVYDIYVNGTLAGDEILKPGFTHYQKTRQSFTYDITYGENDGYDIYYCNNTKDKVTGIFVTIFPSSKESKKGLTKGMDVFIP